MFLIVFEDRTIKTKKVISSEDLIAVKDGYVDIIDISTQNSPVSFDGDKWIPVKEITNV